MEHPFHQFPKYLHHPHPAAPARVVHNKQDEADARADGYSEKYVPKEFPKHVLRADGVTVTANNKAEEKAALAVKAPEAPKE